MDKITKKNIIVWIVWQRTQLYGDTKQGTISYYLFLRSPYLSQNSKKLLNLENGHISAVFFRNDTSEGALLSSTLKV